MQSNTESSSNDQRPLLTKRTRWYVFILLFIMNVNVDVAPGIMASAGNTIKSNLGMMDLEYSLFTSMYAMGRMIGSLLFVSLVNAVNRKFLIVVAIFLKAITIYIFKYTNDGYFLLGVRLISGIGYVFPVIYGPIWADQLAMPKWKYFMMSAFSICGSLGRSSGYILDYFMGANNWKGSFVINGTVLLICSILMFLIPNSYFSSKLVATSGKEGEQLRLSQARVVSIFNVRESELNERDINFFNKYWVIFSNPVYIFALLARVVIHAMISMLVFWVPNYLSDVIKYQNREILLLCYVSMICCLPLVGSIMGSYASAAVGGYSNKHSLVIVLIFNLVACLCFYPSPYLDKWYGFLACCSLFQICGSAVIPNLNGIILSSIPGQLKAKGFAIANVAGLFLGTLPAPAVYGLLNDEYKSIDNRLSMRYFMIYSFVGLLWIIIAVIFRYRVEENNQKKEPFKQDKNAPEPEAKLGIQTGEGADLQMPVHISKQLTETGKEINQPSSKLEVI